MAVETRLDDEPTPDRHDHIGHDGGVVGVPDLLSTSDNYRVRHHLMAPPRIQTCTNPDSQQSGLVRHH